ncbi:MAG TPA: MFS transporter [Thermodesulfovibrionia bacterium]|nr:MFS transporter [Thermodesulfovibrionia bacterium]
MKVTYLDLIRQNRNFRYLWLGQIVSLFGDWFSLIASAVLVSSLTHSGAAVGWLFVVRMLSPFAVSFVGGVVADRHNRKGLLIVADISRFVIVLGFLLVHSREQLWLLYVLTAVKLGISGFFFPARNAILPSVVDKSALGAATALSSVTWSVMFALGTAIGGIVAGQFGVYAAFIVDAVTYIISALLISQVECGEDRQNGSKGVKAAFRQYLDGLSFLRKHLDIFVAVMHKAAVTLISSGGFQVIQVALAQDVFMIGKDASISMGIMYAIVGIGTGLGPIVGRRYTGDNEPSLCKAISVSYLMIAAGIALTATMLSFNIVLLGIFLRGAGGGTVWVFSTYLLMNRLPDKIRGRIFATEFALFTLMTAVSSAITGWAVDFPALGLSGTMWTMAALAVIPALFWTFFTKKYRYISCICEP